MNTPETTPAPLNPVKYLGDGAYVEFSGYDFKIMANDHRSPSDTVYLEPSGLKALFQFAKKQGFDFSK